MSAHRVLLSFVIVAGGCHLVGETDGLYVVAEEEDEALAGSGGAGGSDATAATASAGGSEYSCTRAEQCPLPTLDCLEPKCTLGECEEIAAEMGKACTDNGGTLCDGEGQCVECLGEEHCEGICVDNACAPPTCTDGTQAGDETDEDCGGSCPPCENGKGCLAPKDCESHVCPDNTCAACTEQAQCPAGTYCAELDGICNPKKSINQSCTEDYECNSGNCELWEACWY